MFFYTVTVIHFIYFLFCELQPSMLLSAIEQRPAPNGSSAPTPAPPKEESSTPELDIQKLHALPSEQQDLYLLTFSASLQRFVASLTADEASAHQIHLKKSIFSIITLSAPLPSRVVRNNLSRSLAGIFEKGDRKLLFESINELVAIIAGTGGGKSGWQTTPA